MAICNDCNLDMLEADSCTYDLIGSGEIFYDRIKYGDEADDWGADRQKCHDCNVVKGGLHHNGCDVERCPKCKNQLISCGCRLTELGKSKK